MTTFSEYLSAEQELVDRWLDALVPSEATPPEVIHRAMRYSLFAGGKRVRPILCLAAARTVCGEAAGIEPVACSLELIHTYSLIHDDLPALDNDDYRRGRLTCHKVFGDAMAILAGDALLTLAFEVLANIEGLDTARRASLILELARASGTVGGMIGGQVFDLEGERQQPTAELLERIHRAKTGALLSASVRMGAMAAGAPAAELDALTCYGSHIGLAFQIVDDILDVEQSSEQLGKTAGKDAEQHKITFPAVYGLAESHRMATEECAAAHSALEMLGDRALRLRELADLVLRRSK
jgi:geranylgeranyl diphosphate synthase, type II